MLENIRARPDRAAALEHYRALAPRYDASCWAVAGMRRRAHHLLDLAAGDVVVDVACGTGPMLSELGRSVGRRGRVFGIEQSPEMLAVARERLAREGAASNVTLVEASVEDARLEFEADALLFFYTHDVLQSPEALANLFRAARPGARVVSAGARFRAWPWAAPLNLWTAVRARRYLTTYNGLSCPWRNLQRYCPDFAPLGSNFLGTAYLGCGTFLAERPAAI
jgi:ubiquinone/menaquinone biosynthesis C-methylase UbiE